MGLTALIDADIILYEAGYKSQRRDEETGEFVPVSVEKAYEIADKIIADICNDVFATEPPILFFTGKNNFRYNVVDDYKENRVAKERPFHFANIKAYLRAVYECREEDGYEADDLCCIEQQSRLHLKDTIICSRDKDLKIQQGFHYSWEVKFQPRFGPTWVDDIGVLALKRGGKKLFGTGKRFFYSQLLTGDKTDNIHGIRGYGPIRTVGALLGCNDVNSLESRVLEIYREHFGEDAERRMTQTGQLLWMVNERNEDGSPVMWELGLYD